MRYLSLKADAFSALLRQFLVALLVGTIAIPLPLARAQNEGDSGPDVSITNPMRGDPLDDYVALDSELEPTDENAPDDSSLEESFFEQKNHPLDYFRLLVQEAYPTKSRIGENLTVSITHGNGEDILFARDFFGSTKKSFSYDQPRLEQSEDGIFRILYQGEVLHKFKISPRSLLFYGNFLVWLEGDGNVPEGSGVSLNFIDLRYHKFAVGQTRLPIFRLPVEVKAEAESLRITDGTLYVGDVEINSDVLETYSYVQQLAESMTASIVDPKTHEEVRGMVEDFATLFDKGLELSNQSANHEMNVGFGADGRTRSTLQNLLEDEFKSADQNRRALMAYDKAKSDAEGNKERTAALKAYQTNLESNADYVTTLNQIAEKRTNQKKLVARMKLLFTRLTLPQPDAAPAIVDGLAMVAMGLAHRNSSMGVEGGLQVINSKWMKYGVPVAGAAIYSAMNPEVANYIYEGMVGVKNILGSVLGTATGLGIIALAAGTQTLSGLNPYTVAKTYIFNGRWLKTAIGLTAVTTVLLASLGLPHFIVNGTMLYRDLKARRDIDGDQPFIKRFANRQNEVQRKFLEDLADSYSTKVEYTTEQTNEIEALIAELRQKDLNSGTISRLKNYFKKTNKDPELVERLENAEQIVPHLEKRDSLWSKVKGYFGRKSPREIEGWRRTLTHFLFSSASFTIATHAYLKIWNGWFGTRSFVWRPDAFMTFLYYPNFFGTAAADKGKIHVPTEINGGLRPLWKLGILKLKELFGDSQLKNLRAFESHVLKIEEAVEKEALKRTFLDVFKLMKDKRTLQKFVDSRGLSSVTDNSYYDLSGLQRRFFNNHLAAIEEQAVRTMLLNVFGSNSVYHLFGPPEEVSLAEIKKANLENVNLMAESEILNSPEKLQEAASAIVDKVATQALFEESLKSAESGGTEIFTRSANSMRIARFMDPSRNRQVARIQAVNKQKQDPQAVARAVRSTIAAVIVDKPLELGLLFILLAGVQSGMNVPIHDEMFGEDSLFYLGRLPFFTGYAWGVIEGVMAGPWLKLQQDEQHEGHFGDVPKGKDAKGGFLGWYKKKLFAPENTLAKNQWHYSKLIWANMRAAFVLYAATWALTIGRFDLDLYISGYLFAYALPTGGLAFKLEQAFELAKDYYARKIPKRFRPHPASQEYINGEVTAARIRFNIIYKTYENFLGVYLNTLQTINLATYGTRAFVRTAFQGVLPSEFAVNVLSKTEKIPGLGAISRGCKFIFTNNLNLGG